MKYTVNALWDFTLMLSDKMLTLEIECEKTQAAGSGLIAISRVREIIGGGKA